MDGTTGIELKDFIPVLYTYSTVPDSVWYHTRGVAEAVKVPRLPYRNGWFSSFLVSSPNKKRFLIREKTHKHKIIK